MLFEEWVKGTGCANEDEFKMAEELYKAMPENFQKKDLYELRTAMNEDHFIELCKLVKGNTSSIEKVQHEYERLKSAFRFVDTMINILKTECNMDVIAVYAAHMAEKASKSERERITKEWEELND